MKINSTLEKALNNQINREFQASYNYLAYCYWFENTPYSGFAQWMKRQSDEERTHADKFLSYLNDRQGCVKLKSLSQPEIIFKTPLEIFKAILKQEQNITKNIHEIYVLADKEKDLETIHFLGWFLEEQMEEEKSVLKIIERLELISDSPLELFNFGNTLKSIDGDENI